MSRPNLGAEHVEKLAGERETKTRLKLILQSLGQELSVNDAAERLGVCVSRFHELRDEALMGALEALAPRPAGRPPAAAPNVRIMELEDELEATRYQLEVQRVRNELLITMPHVVLGKTRPPRAKREERGGDGRPTRS